MDLVAHVVARGEEEDGGGDAGVAQAARDGEAVHVGEHDVEDDQVGARGLGFVECAASVLGGDDVEAGEAQGGGEEVADVGFVVDDEQFCLCSGGAHGVSVAHESECFLGGGCESCGDVGVCLSRESAPCAVRQGPIQR